VLELGFPDILRIVQFLRFEMGEFPLKVVDFVEKISIAKMGIHIDDWHWRPLPAEVVSETVRSGSVL
jgi:hypothetical protein